MRHRAGFGDDRDDDPRGGRRHVGAETFQDLFSSQRLVGVAVDVHDTAIVEVVSMVDSGSMAEVVLVLAVVLMLAVVLVPAVLVAIVTVPVVIETVLVVVVVAVLVVEPVRVVPVEVRQRPGTRKGCQ